ncbi:UDP-N-acetylmuramoyl-tripeptide--D-alanyl-D-alanine ligase [candidate division KSB1 bacterium]|nr:UDP-N-acetylmuramoyl-tripeptide--D-alanyl-D-alanine ligase [candidate division KSB1 bacterium]
MSDLILNIPELLNIGHCRAKWKGAVPPPGKPIAGVSTDSRHVKAGELFVAIVGEKFDGHDFIGQVVEKKVLASVVNESWYAKHKNRFSQAFFIVVPDTLVAYQEFAGYYRNKFDIPVIAVTGSAGKTTCKDLITNVLKQKYNVLKNIKSFNNHIGVPATLFDLRPEHEILVTELGTNHTGELERLSYLVRPSACLITNIGYAHLEFFKNLDGVAKAKMEIFSSIQEEGIAFYNADDKVLRTTKFPVANQYSYGIDNPADVSGRIVGCDEHACYTFTVMDKQVHLQLPGRHNVYNALAASAVGNRYMLSADEIKRGLENATAGEKRMQVINVHNLKIINDTYNANPGSCYAALNTLSDMQVRGKGRRIAVLGDMLELGDFSKPEHEKLAKVASQFKINALFLYGNETRAAIQAAQKLSFEQAEHFETKNTLQDRLAAYLQDDDIVLVKGSRSMRMETVVEYLNSLFKDR